MGEVQMIVGDVSLAVLDQGDGPTILFLHGEDGLIFSRPFLDELSATHRVLAPDHPAWGESTRPAYIADTHDLGSVYAELLEQLDGPVVVVGSSFGGWVAAELALQARVPLAGLVLVAPIGIKIGDREERDYADIFIADFEELPGIYYGDPSRAPALADRSDEDYLYLARAQEATARYAWKPYMHDPKLRHWLRRITAPTMVVAGTRDRFALLPGFYETYASLIGTAGAELRQVEGAGHRVEEEEPADLARLVREFMGDAAAGAPAVGATTGAR
jgi:pimeloyl-ACP methyl ester carboxylesterase